MQSNRAYTETFRHGTIHSQLLTAAWGFIYSEATELLKVEDDPSPPTLIQTVHGVGYRLILAPATTSPLQKRRKRYKSKRLPIQKFACLNKPADKFQMSHVKVEI